jgi:G3E family GTPase
VRRAAAGGGVAVSVPVTLVTGFLGAGKSTLINRVMAESPDRRFGLVVNEFGDVGLESQIIEAGGNDIVELSNGCMCCVVRDDLCSTLSGLLERSPGIEQVILEASGLSDPVPIANAFLNDDLGGRIRFDAVVCVVDPARFASSIREYPVAEDQIGYADFVLLSKVDESSERDIEEAKKLVRGIKPEARIVEMDGSFRGGLVFDTSGADHGELAGLEIEEHHHHEEVDTLFYKTDRPLDLDRFGAFLKSLPREVVRAKGFLLFSDRKAAKSKYVLQVVGSRPLLSAKSWRKDEPRRSAIVFIGRGFDRNRLERELRACELN